jgi:delta 1-pyrroline-5-carboxylate dehydrogenase
LLTRAYQCCSAARPLWQHATDEQRAATLRRFLQLVARMHNILKAKLLFLARLQGGVPCAGG